VWTLLVMASAPQLWRALKAHSRPRPESAPAGCAYWPLWYAATVFSLARMAGALLVLALFLDAIYPVRLG